MDNQGIGQGASLGLKNTGNRLRIKGITRKSINGLCRQPYNPTLSQEFHGITDPFLSMNNPGTHIEKS